MRKKLGLGRSPPQKQIILTYGFFPPHFIWIVSSLTGFFYTIFNDTCTVESTTLKTSKINKKKFTFMWLNGRYAEYHFYKTCFTGLKGDTYWIFVGMERQKDNPGRPRDLLTGRGRALANEGDHAGRKGLCYKQLFSSKNLPMILQLARRLPDRWSSWMHSETSIVRGNSEGSQNVASLDSLLSFKFCFHLSFFFSFFAVKM